MASSMVVVAAVPAPSSASAVSLTGKYIGAFLACNTAASDCSNPQNHMTYLAESNDGVHWSPVPGFKPFPGSVPDVIRRGDSLYVYNPGTVVRFDLDTGSQTQPSPVRLQFSNGSSTLFVDPSVYLDQSGTLHLFFLPGIRNQDPAQCPPGQPTCTKYILSATEVSGSDGGSFVVDQGVRTSYVINQCCFSDPAVFEGPGGYYLYTSMGQETLAFESSTLTGSYTAVQGLDGGVLTSQGTGGVPAGYYDNASQSFWTYVTQGQNPVVIMRASTPNIDSEIPGSSFQTVISGCTFLGLGCSYMAASPAVHLNTAGPASYASSATQSSSSPSATGSSGAVPEFPYQLAAVVATTMLAVVSYLVLRRRPRPEKARTSPSNP